MFNIYQIGVQKGDFIIGVGKQNNGTILEVGGEEDGLVYPPSLSGIATLSKTDISHKMRVIEFFSDMSAIERLEWLTENATDNEDLYLSDVGFSNKNKKGNFPETEMNEIQLRIVKLGGSFMLEHYSEISHDEWFTAKEFEDIVPLKPGSRGLKGHSTLILRPGAWCLYIEERKTEWEGLYIKIEDNEDEDLVKAILEEGEINVNSKEYKDKKMLVFEDENVIAPNFAIVYESRKESYTWGELFELAPEELQRDMKLAKEYLRRFTSSPAFFKSLLQKIIRFRALKCEFSISEEQYNLYKDEDDFHEISINNKTEYRCKLNAQATLLATISHLIMHPGAFVPNIQRFVSGIESGFKRVAVAICEDSWTKKKKELLALYCASALAQREKSFIPTTQLITTLFTLAIETQQESKAFIWELGKDYEYDQVDSLTACSMVLEHVKSFQTDIDMVRYIADIKGKSIPHYSFNKPLDSFPIWQAIDHHTNPELAYFFCYENIADLSYSDLFHKIWDISSGFNARKRKFEESEDLTEIMNAQRLCMMAKFPIEDKSELPFIEEEKEEEEEEEKYEFKYRIDDSWLAGLIGPIQIKNAFVVLRTDDLTSFTAIKKPSRTDKNPELTEEEKETVIEEAKEILKKGIKIKNCPASLDIFMNAKVKYDEENNEYLIKLEGDKEWQKWEDCTELYLELKYHETLNTNFNLSFSDAITTTGEGIDKHAFDYFNELIIDLEQVILRRLATTIAGLATEIKLQKIGRDGTGIDYTVYTYDTKVFYLLCLMCNLFPAALELKGINFMIKNGPLFWHLRDLINNKIADNEECEEECEEDGEWEIKKDKRKMWEHQKDIVDTMIQKDKKGKKGNIIWLQMGSGKSMCVTQFLRYLIKNNKLCKYVVWTLPPSAVDSIEKEIKKAGFESKLLDCRKNQDQEIEEFKINIVKHDHLRLNGFDEQLKNKSSNCFFIVDEFHKTLSKTQRTSITLDLVRLCNNFIALSGTIIRDAKSIDDLIVWLQTVCEFEVNKDNFYVGVGSLLSRKIPSKIIVNRELVEVENEEYFKYVPLSLGGTASTINFKAAVQVSFDAITEGIIDKAKEYLESGEKVFIVTKDVEMQKTVAKALKEYTVFNITNKNSITLGPDDEDTDIDVVITTSRMCEGYTLSLLRVGITAPFFSNQNTRDQLVGRLVRLNSKHDTVDWIIVTSGILTHIYQKQEESRNLSEALKGFAKEINLDKKELKNLY